MGQSLSHANPYSAAARANINSVAKANAHSSIQAIQNAAVQVPAPADLTINNSLFYDDFSNGFDPSSPSSPYMFFSPATNDAAGGVTVAPNNLTIYSSPYTVTFPFFADNLKYSFLSKKYYEAPSQGEIVFETIMSAQQTGLENLPDYFKAINGSVTGVNNVNSDHRSCCSYFAIGDVISTYLVFGVLLTNEDIYFVYERSFFAKAEYGGPYSNYDSSIQYVPLGKRNVFSPLSDFVKASVAYNYAENYILVSLNDQVAYTTSRLGYPLEKKYGTGNFNQPGQLNPSCHLLRPTALFFAILNGSALSEANPQNPGDLSNAGLVDMTLGGLFPQSDPNGTNVDGTNKPALFLAPYNAVGLNGTLFGQGVNSSFKYFSVYTLKPNGQVIFSNGNNQSNDIALSPAQQNQINGVNSTDFVYQ